jgi:hypothetical protein
VTSRAVEAVRKYFTFIPLWSLSPTVARPTLTVS